MTQFHYIGSPTELPLGVRGTVSSIKKYSEVIASPEYKERQAELRKQGMIPLEEIIDLSHLKDADCLVYDTQEDAAGIYLTEVEYWNGPIQKHFRSPYVYRISSEGGSFQVSPELKKTLLPEQYNCSVKSCRELFKLIMEFGTPSSEFELYTCWADEEDEPRKRKLDRIIDLAEFQLEDGFELLEKQYVVVII